MWVRANRGGAAYNYYTLLCSCYCTCRHRNDRTKPFRAVTAAVTCQTLRQQAADSAGGHTSAEQQFSFKVFGPDLSNLKPRPSPKPKNTSPRTVEGPSQTSNLPNEHCRMTLVSHSVCTRKPCPPFASRPPFLSPLLRQQATSRLNTQDVDGSTLHRLTKHAKTLNPDNKHNIGRLELRLASSWASVYYKQIYQGKCR